MTKVFALIVTFFTACSAALAASVLVSKSVAIADVIPMATALVENGAT